MADFLVTNLNDSGAGSLRDAIASANLAGSPSTIDFAVDGTITLASDLPTISNNVTIDGTTAPTYAGTAPVVAIDCGGHSGLVFGAGSANSQLLGMAVDNASGNGVTLDAGSITLNNNYIGLDLAGAAAGNAGDGVYVAATSSNNLIGLNPSGASDVVANVISGNGGNGISFHNSSGNTVVANRIGTDPTGTMEIGNAGNGIWVTAASNANEIGGTIYTDGSTGTANNPTGTEGSVTPVFVVPPLGNLVSGNGETGILIDANSQFNTLNGNFVGTTADGNAALGNAGDGVWIDGANNNSLVGCQVINDPFVYYNVVSGNAGNGLRITDSDNATVQGNFFGLGADNTSLVGNQLDGILVEGSSTNTQVGGVIPLGNVTSGNGTNGIEVTGTVSGFTTFNTFGGLLAFKGAAPNGNDGLLITSTGGNNLVRTNVFSGNTNNGIEIAGDASGVTVDPVIAGLNTNGNGVLPNGNDGLLITDTAHDNVIGGYLASVIPENTFSGNGADGVAILGQAYGNSVFNSDIGTDVLGTTALGNGAGGVLIGGSATNNTVGGASSDPSMPTANLISGNDGNGLTLTSGTSLNQVIDNEVGLDRFGLPVLPNSGTAILASGTGYNVVVPSDAGVAAGIQRVLGAGSGTITGGSGSNYLDVTLAGVATTNVIVSAGENDVVAAGAGAATVLSTGDNALIAGGSGSLYVAGEAAAETVFGSTGDNTVFAAQGGEYFLGQAAGTSSEFIDGSGSVEGGTSTVIAGTGKVTVFGATGAHPDQELVFGGSGALTFVAGSGAASVIAGAGQVTLFGGSGGSTYLAGSTGSVGELLVAGSGNETLSAAGTTVGNTLYAGTDTSGGGSNDWLVGGSGNDTFVGGNGQTTMTGGAGTDYFVFDKAIAGGTTTINDFASNETLGIFGYGLSANAIVSGSSVSAGSTTISLSDNTKITLIGFTDLTTSNIAAT
jgi:hypothetical protein